MSNKKITVQEAFLLVKDLDAILTKRDLDDDDAEIALVLMLANRVHKRGEDPEVALARISEFFLRARDLFK